jgi:hypothetical protein
MRRTAQPDPFQTSTIGRATPEVPTIDPTATQNVLEVHDTAPIAPAGTER